MSTFIGEIKLFAGDFIPRGWLACEGQLLDVASYAALASLLGKQYDGNGTTTFGLPDLRGRTPIGTGSGPGLNPRKLAQSGGQQSVILQQTQMPAHNHIISNTPNVDNTLTVAGKGVVKCAGTAGNTADPTNAFFAKTKKVGGDTIYISDANQATANMNSAALDISAKLKGNIGVTVSSNCQQSGGNVAHENMQPWLCLNYIINWDGVYPPRN